MNLKSLLKKIIPGPAFSFYHLGLATVAALYYRFPSRNLYVIGITGTKGKTTTTELLNAILERAGKKTAMVSTLQFKIGSDTKRNMLKMTMPGRFFLQKFLAEVDREKCDYVLIEMTSEGAKYWRHKFIDLNALVFTGLTPEHIESHGSYENYVAAKLRLGRALEISPKTNKAIFTNTDSEEAGRFLALSVANKISFNKEIAKPYTINDQGIEFSFSGEVIKSRLVGNFNLYNLVAAAAVAKFLQIEPRVIKEALENFSLVPGRMEEIKLTDPKLAGKQQFKAIVDYAHTPESLEQVYKTYKNQKKICVLGGTGGGRDGWKREVIGSIADNHCDWIILTDEDPYDENPEAIIEDIKKGIKNKKPTVIMDRRAAIHAAITLADQNKNSVVLITGKGTDPYIMGPHGSKTPWSDADVTREELERVLS